MTRLTRRPTRTAQTAGRHQRRRRRRTLTPCRSPSRTGTGHALVHEVLHLGQSDPAERLDAVVAELLFKHSIFSVPASPRAVPRSSLSQQKAKEVNTWAVECIYISIVDRGALLDKLHCRPRTRGAQAVQQGAGTAGAEAGHSSASCQHATQRQCGNACRMVHMFLHKVCICSRRACGGACQPVPSTAPACEGRTQALQVDHGAA